MNIERHGASFNRTPETQPAEAVFDMQGLHDRIGELTEPNAVVGGRALELATQEALGVEGEGDADRGRAKLANYMMRTADGVVDGLEGQLH